MIVALLVSLSTGCSKEENRSDNAQIRQLVDHVITAYGGRAALQEITGYIAEGQLHAPHRNVLIRTTRWFQRPDQLLLELAYSNQPEWRLTLGNQSWKGTSRSTLKPATGPVIWSMRLQTARFDLPLRLLEVERELVLLKTDARGRTVLRHELDKGLRMDYHIDPTTHYIVKMTMGMDGPPAMDFVADYSGFSEVGGVIFPHREVTWAGGTVTSKVVIDRIILNPENLDQQLLAPMGDFVSR